MEQNNDITKEKKWEQITEKDRYKIEGYLDAGLGAAIKLAIFKANLHQHLGLD